jgi:hypothetical protein
VTDPGLPLLFHQLANARDGELSVLFHLAKCDVPDDIEEESGGFPVSLGLLGDELKECGFGQFFGGHGIGYLHPSKFGIQSDS